MAAAFDTESLEFAECERRLLAWGRWSKRLSDGLGYPSSSGIARMIETVRVFEKQAQKPEEQLTAKGKQTRVMKPLTVSDAPVDVMEVDRMVAQLPSWMLQVVSRSYRFGQPDRVAARELEVPRWLYTSRRERAVMYLAGKLVK